MDGSKQIKKNQKTEIKGWKTAKKKRRKFSERLDIQFKGYKTEIKRFKTAKKRKTLK